MDLLPILYDLGIGDLRRRGDEITGLCPKHAERTGRQDRHASWSINNDTGLHQCFSCGYAGNLETLFIDLTGNVPADIHMMLQKAALSTMSSHPIFTGDADEDAGSEWDVDYDQLIPVPPRMLERKNLSAEAAATFGVQWNRKTHCWFIPIISPDGEILGAQYKQTGMFMNVPQDVPKGSTLFGFHEGLKHRRVGVVESPLDVVRLWDVGIPAVATFGAKVSADQLALLRENWTYVVSMMDNDKAGRIATQYLKKMLPAVHTFDYGRDDVKDPGEFEDGEELIQLWKKAISPLSALTKLKQ